jgi:hypothetical protein
MLRVSASDVADTLIVHAVLGLAVPYKNVGPTLLLNNFFIPSFIFLPPQMGSPITVQ